MAADQRQDYSSETVAPAEHVKNTGLSYSNVGQNYVLQGSPRQAFTGIRLAIKDETTSNLEGRKDSRKLEPRRIIAQPDEVLELIFESPVLAHRPGFDQEPSTPHFGHVTQKASPEVSISSAICQPSSPSSQVVISLECQVGQLRVGNPYGEGFEQSTAHTIQMASFEHNSVSPLTSPGQASNLDTHSENMKQIMERFSTTLAKSYALQEKLDLQQRELVAKQDIFHTLQTRMEERQKEVVALEKQALERLSMIHSRVQSVLTQTYELLEYPIPRLFIILPRRRQRRSRLNLMTEPFRLYFLCECGAHTMNGSEKTPHTIHLARHEGYDIDRPTEFLEKYGSYILTILQMVRYGIATAATVVPALAIANVVEPLDAIKDHMMFLSESLDDLVEDAISMLQSKADPTSNSIDVPDDQSVFDRVEGLEGADLRQLESFLSDHDTARTLGNLYRMVTNEGHVKWVCKDHYRASYKESFRNQLRDAVEKNGGFFAEPEGKITVTFHSKYQARDFYEVIERAKGIHELDIQLGWDVCRSDLIRLQTTVKVCNVSVLRLHASSFDSPIHDIWNRTCRFDPIVEIMSNGQLQSLTLVKCRDLFKRISHFPSNVVTSNLRYLHLEECFEPSSEQIRKLLKSSPKLKTLRVTRHTLEATLVRLDTEPTSPGPENDGPQYYLTAFSTHQYTPKLLTFLRSVYVGINIVHLSLSDSQCSHENLKDIIVNSPKLRTMTIISGFITPLVISHMVTSVLQQHPNRLGSLSIGGDMFYDRLTVEYRESKVMRIVTTEGHNNIQASSKSIHDIHYDIAIFGSGARLDDPYQVCRPIPLNSRNSNILHELVHAFSRPVQLGIIFEDFLGKESLKAVKQVTKRFAGCLSKMVIHVMEIEGWWSGIQEIATGREAFPRLTHFSVRHLPRLETGAETMVEDCGELLLDWLITMVPTVGSRRTPDTQMCIELTNLRLSQCGWGRLLGSMDFRAISMLELHSVGFGDEELDLLERVVPKDAGLELIFKAGLDFCTRERLINFRKAFKDCKTRVSSKS